MTKAYSLDLRRRAVRFVDSGHSRNEAAATSMYRWLLWRSWLRFGGRRAAMQPSPKVAGAMRTTHADEDRFM